MPEDHFAELKHLLKYAFDESDERMVDQGRILTPKSEEAIMRESEVLVLRQLSDGVSALTREMGTNREMMMGIREDMAVIKERQRAYADVRDDLSAVVSRIEAIEKRNAQQDGAMSFATLLKDFGPWIMAIGAAIYAFFKR